jgi:hypothetical protein
VLSYYAYRDVGVVNESYWLIGLEYAALLGAVVWDLLNLRKQSSLRIRESNEAVS